MNCIPIASAKKGAPSLLMAVLAVAPWVTCSCTGHISEAIDPGEGQSSVGAGPSSRPGVATGKPGLSPAEGGLPWPVRTEGSPSALRRLTRDELTTSLQALTGQSPPRSDLPEEQRSGHGPLLTAGMSFLGSEVTKLQLVLTQFAGAVAPHMLAQSACTKSGQAQRDCLRLWGQGFAKQALRRPLTVEENGSLDPLVALADGTAEGDTLAVEGLLNAFFFAPSFLYRTEIGIADSAGVPLLTDGELAERLSYLATLAPPDDELRAAAEAGKLRDAGERTRQLQRLSGTPLGKRARSVLVLEWLSSNEPKIALKSSQYLDGLDATFQDRVRQSADRFVDTVFSSGAPTIAQLLTSDAYLRDEPLALITAAKGSGASATGDGSAAARTGLLMHPQVIAAHTKENGSSPFQIGVALREALLCEPVPAPPANAQSMARTNTPSGLSLRESLDYRTSAGPVCMACHSQFKEFGYSFMPFDPVGRWMNQDPSGKPWDLSGNVATYSGQPVSFDSPASLARAMAQHRQVQGCFTQVALEWSLGRKLSAEDQPLAASLYDVTRKSGGDVALLLEAIVASPEFTFAQVAPSSP